VLLLAAVTSGHADLLHVRAWRRVGPGPTLPTPRRTRCG